jgi:hypothetical protein
VRGDRLYILSKDSRVAVVQAPGDVPVPAEGTSAGLTATFLPR